MTEEGKKLFKRAGLGLSLLFGLMLVLRLFSSPGGESKQKKSHESQTDTLAQIEKLDQASPEQDTAADYRALKRLVKLLHTNAFNHLRSGHIKDAIRLWEIAAYLDPSDPIIQIRLKASKKTLTNLIEENTAIAIKDYESLRFERAIEFYKRAANYAVDFNEDVYNKIQRQISRIERQMTR